MDPSSQELRDAEGYFYKSTDMLGCLRAAESNALAHEIRERCIGFSYSLMYAISDLRAGIAHGLTTADLLASAGDGIIVDSELTNVL